MNVFSPQTNAALGDIFAPARGAGSSSKARSRGERSGLGLSFGSGGGRSQSSNLKSLQGVVSRSPSVIVKSVSKTKDGANVARSLNYIARLDVDNHEDITLENEQGDEIKTYAEMVEVGNEWEKWTHRGHDRRTGNVSQHFVFSMPTGTDPNKLLDAVRDVAQEEFANHKYVMGLHTDTDSPHVHLQLLIRDQDRTRRYFDREDYQNLREVFAEKLNERGIDAQATSKLSRGKVNRSATKAQLSKEETKQKLGIKNYVTKKFAAAIEAAKNREPIILAEDKKLLERQTKVIETYQSAAKELRATGDKNHTKLADKITEFVATIRPAKSLATQYAEDQSNALDKAAPVSKEAIKGRDSAVTTKVTQNPEPVGRDSAATNKVAPGIKPDGRDSAANDADALKEAKETYAKARAKAEASLLAKEEERLIKRAEKDAKYELHRAKAIARNHLDKKAELPPAKTKPPIEKVKSKIEKIRDRAKNRHKDKEK